MSAIRVAVALTIVSCALVLPPAVPLVAAEPAPLTHETSIRAGFGQTIVAVRRTNTRPRFLGRTASSSDNPRPRLAGFSPLIAIATSDAAHPLGEFEHVLSSSYVGQPLNGGSELGYVVGFLDSGATINLAAGPSATALGLTGSILTSNTIEIGGVGGRINAAVTMPVGFFAAGLSAVDESGQLDFNALVGHWNVSGLAAPPIECANGEELTAIIGTPFLAFYNSIIRVDRPQRVHIDGVTVQSPDVEIRDPFAPIPFFPHLMSMEFGGPSPVTTASYFPGFFDLNAPPLFPTLLSAFAGTVPLGGLFFADILVQDGQSDPTNPAQFMRVLVDLGAQSSVMSRGMAARLSLPIAPDFTVDVCGVGGLVFDVPAYYVDFVRINTLGGPLLFSRAPFIVIDLPSPEGGVLDGILGMNFFWNRNLVFEPALGFSAFLHISEPIPVAFGDTDVDFDVDLTDARLMIECVSGPTTATVSPECDHLDGDQDGDIDMRDYARFQRCFSGDDITADPTCGQ